MNDENMLVKYEKPVNDYDLVVGKWYKVADSYSIRDIQILGIRELNNIITVTYKEITEKRIFGDKYTIRTINIESLRQSLLDYKSINKITLR